MSRFVKAVQFNCPACGVKLVISEQGDVIAYAVDKPSDKPDIKKLAESPKPAEAGPGESSISSDNDGVQAEGTGFKLWSW
jgi:hypothetical protein